MLLVVKDSADELSYVPTLKSAGYILRIREPEWFEHRLFKGPDTDINLHVFSTGAYAHPQHHHPRKHGFSKWNFSFCDDVYNFRGFGRNAKIKTITSYVIQIS